MAIFNKYSKHATPDLVILLGSHTIEIQKLKESIKFIEEHDINFLENKKFIELVENLNNRKIELRHAERNALKIRKELNKRNNRESENQNKRTLIQKAHDNALAARETLENLNSIATSSKRIKNLADHFNNNFAYFSYIFDAIDGIFAIFRIINGLFLTSFVSCLLTGITNLNAGFSFAISIGLVGGNISIFSGVVLGITVISYLFLISFSLTS